MTDRTDLLITVGSDKGGRQLLFQAMRTGSSASFPLSPDSENKLVKLREALRKSCKDFTPPLLAPKLGKTRQPEPGATMRSPIFGRSARNS